MYSRYQICGYWKFKSHQRQCVNRQEGARVVSGACAAAARVSRGAQTRTAVCRALFSTVDFFSLWTFSTRACYNVSKLSDPSWPCCASLVPRLSKPPFPELFASSKEFLSGTCPIISDSCHRRFLSGFRILFSSSNVSSVLVSTFCFVFKFCILVSSRANFWIFNLA